jgi:hypothetical protein
VHNIAIICIRCVYLFITLALAQRICDAAEVKRYVRTSVGADNTLIVGVACNHADNRVEIGLYTPGELPADRRIDLWDTFDLIKDNPDGASIAKLLHVERRCVLKRDRYRIRLTGEPGNWNMNGECGAITYAKATVWLNGKPIFDKPIASCEDYRTTGAHVLKLIIFQPSSDDPILRSGKRLSDLYR